MTIEFKNEKLDLNVFDEGEGDAVLLLHGWGTNMDVYRNTLKLLTPHKRVISYDIPGFGKSSEPSFPFSTDDYADLAILVLETLGIGKCSLMGHSHGGRTILNIASRDDLPFEIEKIILIDSAGIVPQKSGAFKLKQSVYKFGKSVLDFAPVKKLFPDLADKAKEKLGSADYKNATPLLRESLVKIVNDDYRDRIEKITAPTLLFWGTADTATPISDAYLMREKIKNCGLVELPGAGHYSFLEAPEIFRKVLYSFFEIAE